MRQGDKYAESIFEDSDAIKQIQRLIGLRNPVYLPYTPKPGVLSGNVMSAANFLDTNVNSLIRVKSVATQKSQVTDVSVKTALSKDKDRTAKETDPAFKLKKGDESRLKLVEDALLDT